MTHARHIPPSTRRPAFTLIELMISIALVALLILGVNQVFLYTGAAVGTGQAISDAVRDSRAAQAVFAQDFAGIAPNGTGPADAAFLAIYSAAQPAFLNAADQSASRLGDPLKIDLNGNGTEGESTVPGEVISPATYNSRNHRLDTFGFFSRGTFARQTGNDGTFVDNMTSSEAFVSYGHLQLPDNQPTLSAADYYDPGGQYNGSQEGITPAANPNDYYASQFVLGRVAMLLRVPSTTGQIYDGTSPLPQAYVNQAKNGSTAYLSPLYGQYCTYAYSSTSNASLQGTTAGGISESLSTLNQSRIDLASGSVASLQSGLESYLYAYAQANAGAVNDQWWWGLVGLPTSATSGGLPIRFQCVPFVSKPLTAASMARATPYFLKGCSQFTVEYAGDFMQQDNNAKYATVADPMYTADPYDKSVYYGDTIAAGQDGQIDYTLVPPTPSSTLPRNLWRKQIRWYGLPRNTSGMAGINGAGGDVIPLRDWRKNAVIAPAASPYTAPFEKTVPTYSATYLTTMTTKDSYTCVFGPNDPAPSLIRITVTLVDPSGRLRDGQTYQYVFPVPPQ